MQIKDLQRFPPGHPPSPYEARVPVEVAGQCGVGELSAGLELVAVGWLGTSAPTTGPVPEKCVDRLLDAYGHGLIISDGTKGWHDCQICWPPQILVDGTMTHPKVRWRKRDFELYGHGHYLLQRENIVYMCPALTAHYIVHHYYQPPDEFVRAVMEGTFLTVQDLEFEERVTQ